MDKELIRIEKLQEASQFSTWKFQKRVILNASEIFEVVSGTEQKPEAAVTADDATTKAAKAKAISEWNKKDATAQKIIVTSLGQKMVMHVIRRMKCGKS